jgi:two-component sensor histidine kinase/HAMP domain-containing protein
MKIQTKAAIMMTSVGISILLFITIIYTNLNKRNLLDERLYTIESISIEIAQHLNSLLEANVAISRTLSTAPILRSALMESNAEYASLSIGERDRKIDELNKIWVGTEDISNPFFQEFLVNPPVEYLKFQQYILPGLYGEIFLTNKYGVMIAATGKLTTLAHAHKYWWLASYNKGKGKVFLDDRGFDKSVEGYVLGIVVPIKSNDEIIGILKCNINISGLIGSVIDDFGLQTTGKIKIARTKGLIVAEKGFPYLSHSLADNLIQYLQTDKALDYFVTENGKKELVSFTPVPITIGSSDVGFGGSKDSIGHLQGNLGEGWNIIITIAEDQVLKEVTDYNTTLIKVGIVFIILTSVFALFLGKWVTKPIVTLSNAAGRIGKGDLSTRISINSNDEIEQLATAFNNMTENLENTLTSRNNLTKEVVLRKEAEQGIKRQLEEKEIILKEVNHRIKNNLASISSLLSLQAGSITHPEALAALQDAIGRVNSMYVLYENLLISDNYQFTSVKDYLENLIENLISIFPPDLNLKVEKNIDDFDLDPKKLIPVGIIVNELLTNTMKYAFEGRDSGHIQVTVTAIENQATLIIQDNGRGLPEGFDMKEQTGFGIMLVSMLSEQLNAELSMESLDGVRSTLKFQI